MIRLLHHRGPDGYGYYQDGPVALAHSRLSIIDLATGDQPIANEDRSVWTVFNGEIFNYLEIRAELERLGHVFRTHSDTETLVHAYEEYGDRFVEHLNGQFAIALWDCRRRRLLLARDRVGIRPLFYRWDGGRLLFASEIKSIAAVGAQSLRLNARGLAQVFTFWGTTGSATVFQGVHSLPPGHLLTVEVDAAAPDLASRMRVTPYWDWSFPAGKPVAAQDFAATAEELRELLVDAVRLQLRADVPVGAYLSGGLDSSAIVALVRKYTSNALRTFSVSFEDAEFDESPHQQAVVRHLGTEHTTVRCTRREIGESFPDLIWHLETPVLRTAPAPLLLLSGLVRRSGYKVVLTGEGADEVFCGYDLFKEGRIRRFWASQPQSQWRSALFRRLYPYLKHSPVAGGALATSFFGRRLTELDYPGYAHIARWATTARLWNFFSPDLRAQLAGSDVESELCESLPREFFSWSGLARDQYVEAKTLLAGYLLCSQGDRVAMANSVEGRVPFLDHRVIEFANALPPRYKLRGLKEKAILKAAVADLLPPEVVGRVKQPYRAPDGPSFFIDGQPLPYVEELLSEARIRDAGYFEPRAVQGLFAKCRAGRAIGFSDNMAFVGILTTMLVHDAFIQGRRLS